MLSGQSHRGREETAAGTYRLLAKATPPRGSLGKWKRYTEPLVEAMEGVAAYREGAVEQLGKALNCKACHDQFQIGFYPGLSNLTDLKYYQTLQESVSARCYQPPRRPCVDGACSAANIAGLPRAGVSRPSALS